MLSYIAEIETEKEVSKFYGENWKYRDYYGYRSDKAGEICLIMEKISKAEIKSIRKPKSIGARKARQKAKALRRQLKELEYIVSENISEYHTKNPCYISGPRKCRKIKKQKRFILQYKTYNGIPDFKIAEAKHEKKTARPYITPDSAATQKKYITQKILIG